MAKVKLYFHFNLLSFKLFLFSDTCCFGVELILNIYHLIMTEIRTIHAGWVYEGKAMKTSTHLAVLVMAVAMGVMEGAPPFQLTCVRYSKPVLAFQSLQFPPAPCPGCPCCSCCCSSRGLVPRGTGGQEEEEEECWCYISLMIRTPSWRTFSKVGSWNIASKPADKWNCPWCPTRAKLKLGQLLQAK